MNGGRLGGTSATPTGGTGGGAAAPIPQRTAYRHDMDGLRGLAIMLVVVYHVWFGRVSGGVDIFLALSGFFFVGSLIRAAERPGGIAPVDVVRRLARRLLPALAVVLAAVGAMTILIRPPSTWYAMAKELVSSLTFWQNWRLAKTGSDYLAAESDVSPLQHLWSIAIQGQFYIAAMVIALAVAAFAARRGYSVRLPLAAVLTVLAVVSMIYAITTEREQSWLYYDGAARAWELLAGAVLACIAPWLRAPRRLRVALSVVGLIVVFAAGAVLEGGAQFPGPWALVPVGAALALVVAGADGPDAATDNPVSNWLSSPRLIWLGTIAYALYLWHWPLLIGYLNLRQAESVGLWDGALIIALSMLLAHASTTWLETPIRRVTGPVAVRRTLVGATALLAAIVVGGSVWWTSYIDRATAKLASDQLVDTDRYPGARARYVDLEPARVREYPHRLIASLDQPSPNPDGCMALAGELDAITCDYGDTEADRVLALVGGSHSEHWLPALDQIGRERGFTVRTILKAGCPAVVPATEDGNVGFCEEWTFNVLGELAERPPDAVFATTTRPDRELGGDRVPEDYQAFWAELDALGIPMIGIRDTPWIVDAEGERFSVPDCLSNGGDAVSCGAPRDAVLSVDDPITEVADRFPLLNTIDLSDAFCRDDWCRAIEGNVVIYRDSNHLTVTYARSVVPMLEERLAPLLGWW